jgi:hypothetical protein
VILEPGQKHLFLDISSINIDELVPSLYQCFKTHTIEVFWLLSSDFRNRSGIICDFSNRSGMICEFRNRSGMICDFRNRSGIICDFRNRSGIICDFRNRSGIICDFQTSLREFTDSAANRFM